METHRQHEQQNEQHDERPSLAIRRNSKTNSKSSTTTRDLLLSPSAAMAVGAPLSSFRRHPAQQQPLMDHQQLQQQPQQQAQSVATGSMSCFNKSRTPLLWTVLLAVCLTLVSSSSSPSGQQQPQAQHLRRSDISTITRTTTVAAAARRLNIFGDDDRRPVSDPSLYPYSAVGLLRWSDTLSCTASLIADKFIVTAAECVLDATGTVRKSSLEKSEFLPGYAASKISAETTTAAAEAKTDKAFVTKVHKQSDYWKKWTNNTYVILELDAPIGQHYGILQLPSLSDLDQSAGKTEVQIAGYDDKALDLTKASMQYAKCMCYFPSEFNGPQYMLLHDCDTSGIGSPGSPLLVRYTSMKTYIIGIHSNVIGTNASTSVETTSTYQEYTQANANRGVLGPFIQKHLESLVPSSSSSGSSSADVGKPTLTPIPTPSASSAGGADSRARIDDGDLNTGPGTGSGDSNSSSTNKNERITPAAAYICIAFVCFAWACILFIAVRHIRRGGAASGEITE